MSDEQIRDELEAVKSELKAVKGELEASRAGASIFADSPFGLFHRLVTYATFVGCWIYAVATWGWFIGLGLGWIPGLVIAYIVASLFPLAFFLAFIALCIALVVGFFVFVFSHG